jgi:hypothetical protein
MKRTILIAAALALPYALGAAAADGKAASGKTDSARLIERLDRNNDGFVTRDEARDATELQGRFAELDKDNDGKISAAEMRALDRERSAAGASKEKR